MKLDFNKTYNNVRFKGWSKRCVDSSDKEAFIKEIKHNNPGIIIVSSNMDDISDLPEFCMNSYCPLYRDLDENEQKYYYVNEDAYDDYLREKQGKKSKLDEIVDESMKFIDDECQILNEKERKVLNDLS